MARHCIGVILRKPLRFRERLGLQRCGARMYPQKFMKTEQGRRGAAKGPRSAEERAATLVTQQRRKMAESAHRYVRGSTVKFYEWLERGRGESLPQGPPVWICGDCHNGNLGPVASAEAR